MKKYLLSIVCTLLMAPYAFATVNLANVQCSFTDQAGMKLTISMVKKKNVFGHTNITQGRAQAVRPIRKISLLTTSPSYSAQMKDRKGQTLKSQNIPISIVRIFRQDPSDAVNSVIEVTIPGEKVLRSNNPRSARAYATTNASVIFTNGLAASLKGVCWK